MEILLCPDNSFLNFKFINYFPGRDIILEGLTAFEFSQIKNCETEYLFFIWERYIPKSERHYGLVSCWGGRFSLCLGLSADPMNYLYQREIITPKSIKPEYYVFSFVMLKRCYDTIYFKRKLSLTPIYYPFFFPFSRIVKRYDFFSK